MLGRKPLNQTTEMMNYLWPVILYLTLLIGLIGLMLGAPYLLGSRRHARATHQPYESGIVSVGSTQYRVPIPFYLFAIFFVIFDIEAVFLFAWAISINEVG
jgi:NADH-quinone oxidoreductase subunit A